MIQLFEAPPGSGKTYFAVHYLCKFTSYDEIYGEYILRADVLIISNIEGLKINHWDLRQCLKEKTVEEFFSIDNFEKIMKDTGKNHIILAIDECHEIFPAGFKSDKVYNFFAYHRHIGLDIILMTQDLKATSRIFNPLLEYIVKATPRSRAIMNSFTYTYVTVTGHNLYSKSLQKKQSVFKAYKSQRQDEKNKPKNAVKHWIIITILIFACSGFLFKTALAIVKDKAKPKTPAPISEKERIEALKALPDAPVKVEAVPVQQPYSSPSIVVPEMSKEAGSFEAPGKTQIVGVVRIGNKNKYLLDDGRTINSFRKMDIGDYYNSF